MPLYPVAPRRACPVCGHASYSVAGIHPQCVQKRSEPCRLRRASALAKFPEVESTGKPTSPWYKPCPRCGKTVHVRRKSCICGRSLAISDGTD